MTTSTPPATVIVLNFNTRNLTLACLEHFAGSLLAAGWQLVVVDNGSTDGSASAISAQWPLVQVIRSERNLGFAGGNNLGLAASTGAAVVLMNSDVVCDASTLFALADFLQQNPAVGAASPGLRTVDGRGQAFAYGSDPRIGYLLRRGAGRLLHTRSLDDWEVSEPLYTDWVSGACICVRRAVIDQIGGLDDRFFLYFEDNDWCLRMRMAGWRIVYNPRLSVVHLGGASEPKRVAASQIYQRSLVEFYRKHYGSLQTALVACAMWLYYRIMR